jgi:hypothetical protein
LARELEVAIKRYVSVTLTAAVLGALVTLTGPAHVADFFGIARTRIPDPPSVPCSKQVWYNADRACLSWTAPRVSREAATASVPLLSH